MPECDETLAGVQGLERYTTASGVVYVISKRGRYAWPLAGPGTDFGPYTTEVAAARGEEVDRDIPETDYRVRAAGPSWREVYEELDDRKCREGG